jgi:hypothetical protein
VKNVCDVNYVSLFVDSLKHFFAALNLKGLIHEMPPRMHACLYKELSVTVVQLCMNHVIRHNTPIHSILLTAPQLSISQKALGTFPEDGNVMPKHVGDTIYD